MRLPLILVSLLVFSFACGDDDAVDTFDGGLTDVGPDLVSVSDGGPDGNQDTNDAGNDAGPTDASIDARAADTGPALPTCVPGVAGTCCFDISETIGDLPFVLPDTFDETTPTWNRPTDDCPSEMLSEEAVPFVTYIYCNRGDTAADFQFEVLTVQGEDEPVAAFVPVIVAYSGTDINADPLMCGAFNEPLLGLAELVITLEPNEVVTIVSTTRDAMDYGDIQSVAGEPEE